MGTLTNGAGPVALKPSDTSRRHARGPRTASVFSIGPTLIRTGSRSTGRLPGACAVARTTTSAFGLNGARSLGYSRLLVKSSSRYWSPQTGSGASVGTGSAPVSNRYVLLIAKHAD